MAHEAVIGLECHVQLATRTKMFCGCEVAFGAEPNTRVCPVCLGLPGALPVTNGAAVAAALRLGLALACELRRTSAFARKHYFYPDMPKNYQVSQYDRPLGTGGALRAGEAGAIPITRVHLEEDAGKSFHPERHGDRMVSRVDFNRAGVPLLELVTEPALHDAATCAAFLTELRRLVRWLGISGGDMEKGQLRCDANVSLRPAGSASLGVKTELKNLNSIRGVERGVRAEIERQRALLDSGARVVQATLLYDADHDRLSVMRTKEEAHDYRYFPEPDLPVLELDDATLDAAGAELPELPWEAEARLRAAGGIGDEVLSIVTADRRSLARVDALAAAGVPPRAAANWTANWTMAKVNAGEASLDDVEARLPTADLALLLGRVERGELTASAAKELLDRVWASGGDARAAFTEAPSALGSDEALAPLVREVVAEQADAVAQYLGGRETALGFLIGQVMKKSGGRAVAPRVRELLLVELAKRG